MHTELLLIRHGQSLGNAGLSQDPDCAPSPLGTEQGHAAGLIVAAHELDGFIGISSPYRRARETAGCITAATGIPFTIDELVREWAFSGPATANGILYPAEALESLVERLGHFLRVHHGKKLLIVSHAGPIAVLTQLAWGETPNPNAGVLNATPRWLKVTAGRPGGRSAFSPLPPASSAAALSDDQG